MKITSKKDLKGIAMGDILICPRCDEMTINVELDKHYRWFLEEVACNCNLTSNDIEDLDKQVMVNVDCWRMI